MRFSLSVVSALSLSGCLISHNMGGYGVTPGGVQDMNHARELIESGQIPDHTAYAAEGLFSEHDLPISGAPCAQDLCPRGSVAHHQNLESGRGEALFQLGFGTSLAEGNLVRPDLNLAVAIDISGSMEGEPLDRSKDALIELIGQLGPADEMALIAYGDRAKLVAPLRPMDQAGKDALIEAVQGLESHGSTYMEAGMELAFAQLDRAPTSLDRHSRVFLLTDAQPNLGMTGPESFAGLTRDAANRDIALTVWGVGMNLGSELVQTISTIRGANAYHFGDVQDMEARVRDGFDLMVTPVAYDLEVVATPADALQIEASWGVPVDPAMTQVELGASTLFFSDNEGGMGVTLSGLGDGVRSGDLALEDMPETVASLVLSWTAPDGTAHLSELNVHWDPASTYDDGVTAASDIGPYRMAVLIDEIQALDAAADFCLGRRSQEEAIAVIDSARARLQDRSDDLEDAALQVEADLLASLIENVEAGPQRCH